MQRPSSNLPPGPLQWPINPIWPRKASAQACVDKAKNIWKFQTFPSPSPGFICAAFIPVHPECSFLFFAARPRLRVSCAWDHRYAACSHAFALSLFARHQWIFPQLHWSRQCRFEGGRFCHCHGSMPNPLKSFSAVRYSSTRAW